MLPTVRLTSTSGLARIHQDEGDAARGGAAVDRGVVGGLLHDHIARLEVHFALVLAREMVAIMDKDETLLRAGDVLIQRGTNHAWANRSGKAARIAFVLVDGSR